MRIEIPVKRDPNSARRRRGAPGWPPRFKDDGRKVGFWTKSQTKERRAAPRTAATGGVRVSWKAGDQLRVSLGQCADLSAGGARIVELQDSIPLATDVHLRFMAIDLEADGVVCRSADARSIGVKFNRLTLFGSPVEGRPSSAYARLGKILMGAALLVLIGIAAWSYNSNGSLLPIAVHLRPAPEMVLTSPFFTLGSSKAEVQATQGPPLVVNGNAWDYGKSSVYFSGDRVVGWKVTPDSLLKVGVKAGQTKGPAKDRFLVGATAAEVAAIEGIPLEVRGDVWAYGPSEVYFRDGRVVGWKNSRLRPLKVQGPPVSP